jgi:hypothetical protein
VPDAARQSKGLPLVNLVSLEPQEQVTGLIAVRDFKYDGAYLILATRQGKIKKTPLSDYSSVRSTGIIALNLEPGDELAAARLSHGNGDVMVATRKGQAIRFAEQQVRPMGRATAGVAAIKLRKGDEVVGMDVIRPDSKASLLIVTTKGIGKRTRIAEFPRQGRAGGGVKALTIVPRGGDIAVARVVNPDDDLVVISTNGQVIRMFTDGIPHKGRPAQGVAIMSTREGDQIASIARIPRTDRSGKMIGDDDLEVLSEEDLESDAAETRAAAVKEAEAIVKMPKLTATVSKNGKAVKSDGASPAPKAKPQPAKASPKAAKAPTPITSKRLSASADGKKSPALARASTTAKAKVAPKEPTPITSKKAPTAASVAKAPAKSAAKASTTGKKAPAASTSTPAAATKVAPTASAKKPVGATKGISAAAPNATTKPATRPVNSKQSLAKPAAKAAAKSAAKQKTATPATKPAPKLAPKAATKPTEKPRSRIK